MGHGARQHAKYSASNAHRILRCPGQVALSQTVPPRPDSEFSAEGTEAHEALELSLTGGMRWIEDHPAEVQDAVTVVHEWLEQLAIRQGKALTLRIEEPYAFPQSVVPAEDAGGIGDLTVLDREAREAWIVDFKFGAGVPVEPERNAQLLFGACGMLWHEPVAQVHLVVIQPRIPHHPKGIIRTWACTSVDLAEFQMEMEAAIRAAEEVCRRADHPDAWTKAGPWCRWCPAEPTCPGRERSALGVAYDGAPPPPAQIGTRTLPDPKTLGLDRIAYILQHSGTLTSWLSAIETHARDLAKQGIMIPGHKLVEAQARRVWHGEPEAIADALMAISGYLLGLDDVMPRELLDITKAEALLAKIARDAAGKGEKLHAARAAKDAMAFLTLKQSSGNLVLVPESDSRPAADRASVAFAGVQIPPQ